MVPEKGRLLLPSGRTVAGGSEFRGKRRKQGGYTKLEHAMQHFIMIWKVARKSLSL